MTTELERSWTREAVDEAEAIDVAIEAVNGQADMVENVSYGSETAKLAGRQKAEHMRSCVDRLRVMRPPDRPKIETTGEMHTCPRRAEGPLYAEENADTWNVYGADRTCSYCGSWHPDEFLAFVKTVDGVDGHLDVSDKKYKIYVRRKGIKNAGEGAIKFYFQHAPKDQAFYDAVNEAVGRSG